MLRADMVEQVMKVLVDGCDIPSEELRRMGNVFIKLADALEGQNMLEAKAIIQSAEILLQTAPA